MTEPSAPGSAFLAAVRDLLDRASARYETSSASEALASARSRLDEPLRVALAGKIKAGKSTLLNALVGEELAPTDAGECTRIVTWYRDGLTYRVTLHPRSEPARQVPFVRDNGAIEVPLGDFDAGAIDHIDVEWPSSRLAAMTLIDTPGTGSLSVDVSARAEAFLNPEDQAPEADAVLYLMRHLHRTDLDFLEAFRDERNGSPVNAVAVLSRADEVGVGRPDSLDSAARIAARCAGDARIRAVASTVVPVAGLLAQSGTTLREDEFRALAQIAAASAEEVDRILLSADRFVNGVAPFALTDLERAHLLDRFGIFGIRFATGLLRSGTATSSTTLSSELIRTSGLVELRRVLLTRFAERSDLLKARSGLAVLESVLERFPPPDGGQLASEVERVVANAHELAELRSLNQLRTGGVTGKADDLAALEQLLGAEGGASTIRLGLDPSANPDEVRAAAVAALGRWQRRAEHPLTTPELAAVARTAVRTCEALLVGLAQPGAEPSPP